MFDSGMFGGGVGSFLSGLFGGGSNDPYQSGMDQYQQWAQQGINAQQPFYKAGTNAIGNYQNWLGNMQDPSQFINGTMNQYQSSPWSQNLQKQSINSANAAGSASGMTGSTPMNQQIQQNASNISSGDMQNWLTNVLGVNNQYGQGQQNLMNMGQGAANQMTGMYAQMAPWMGEQGYNKQQNSNNNFMNMLGGGLGMLGGLFG